MFWLCWFSCRLIGEKKIFVVCQSLVAVRDLCTGKA